MKAKSWTLSDAQLPQPSQQWQPIMEPYIIIIIVIIIIIIAIIIIIIIIIIIF